MLDEFVDAANIVMGNGSGNVNFALEPGDGPGILEELRPKSLQRDSGAEGLIVTLINLSHSPLADKANDTEASADQYTGIKDTCGGFSCLKRSA
jgi:sugar/nucleoside kinase (ribokinase family)